MTCRICCHQDCSFSNHFFPLKRPASLDIMGEYFIHYPPPLRTSRTSQHHGIEGFKRGPQSVLHYAASLSYNRCIFSQSGLSSQPGSFYTDLKIIYFYLLFKKIYMFLKLLKDIIGAQRIGHRLEPLGSIVCALVLGSP